MEELTDGLKSRPYEDISVSNKESNYTFTGPDRIDNEKNFLIHPARGLVSFCMIYQYRRLNNKLIKKELEKTLAEEYFGQSLSKEDMELLKDTVITNLMPRFPIAQRYVDVIIDLQKKRIYVKSCGENNLWRSVNNIAHYSNIQDISMRPWFSGQFIERAGGWENSQIIFIHWLNNLCTKENSLNVYAGTKLNIKDNRSNIKITGDHARFNGIWDQFQAGRKIDSVEVVLKEKCPAKDDKPESLAEVLRYRLSLKKLGFNDVNIKDYRPGRELYPSVLNERVTSLESFLDHFDAICLAFQNQMQSQNMKEIYEGIIKWDNP